MNITRHTETYTKNHDKSYKKSYVVGIDIGTTTITVCLYDTLNHAIVKTYTSLNPQRNYGADVISRIKASNEGRLNVLRDAIRDKLSKKIRDITVNEGIGFDKINKIAIAGNTVMIHLLMGYSCEGLGTYPYTPVNMDTIMLRSEDLLANICGVPIIIIPGIAAFVGGDIVAGLLYCGFHKADKPCLFIDIGTNGEMVIGNKDKILVTSTAAGPAFEGCNISCGTGSIPGAISHITIDNNEALYDTIDNKPPIGLCGTGVIEMVSELLSNNLIDDTGLLADPYFEKGYMIAGMYFTQKDIRQLQLAKAAIRTGVEMLMKGYGITADAIDRVYLAGGFGYGINIRKAVNIGMLPNTLSSKVKAVGNSSLAGALHYITYEKTEADTRKIIKWAKEIRLSQEADFNRLYIDYMSF